MTTPTSESVREIIRENVFDPEIGINIVDLGLVYDIQVPEGKRVDLKMTLTSPGCPIGHRSSAGCRPMFRRRIQTWKPSMSTSFGTPFGAPT